MIIIPLLPCCSCNNVLPVVCYQPWNHLRVGNDQQMQTLSTSADQIIHYTMNSKRQNGPHSSFCLNLAFRIFRALSPGCVVCYLPITWEFFSHVFWWKIGDGLWLGAHSDMVRTPSGSNCCVVVNDFYWTILLNTHNALKIKIPHRRKIRPGKFSFFF